MNIYDFSEETLEDMFQDLRFPNLANSHIDKDFDVSKNTNPEVCAKCGGYCCKKCGCHFSPDDFDEISFDYLKSKIEKGYISITRIDVDDLIGVYILKMRNLGAPIVEISIENAPCVFLTSNGCSFEYDDRPSGGKLLVPGNTPGDCRSIYDILDCCFEWRPHQILLNRLADYFEGKDISYTYEIV